VSGKTGRHNVSLVVRRGLQLTPHEYLWVPGAHMRRGARRQILSARPLSLCASVRIRVLLESEHILDRPRAAHPPSTSQHTHEALCADADTRAKRIKRFALLTCTLARRRQQQRKRAQQSGKPKNKEPGQLADNSQTTNNEATSREQQTRQTLMTTFFQNRRHTSD
jgi:hypothetical protein